MRAHTRRTRGRRRMQDALPLRMRAHVRIQRVNERRILEAGTESLDETAAPVARRGEPVGDVLVRHVTDNPGCRLAAQVGRHPDGQRIAEPGEDGRITPCVTLAELLKLVTLVDLIDMDIQGAEVRVIKAGIEELNSKVKRLHIATHDPETEVNLRRAFHQEGWRMAWDFSGGGTNATPFGLIEFQDGVQSWVNKRFE